MFLIKIVTLCSFKLASIKILLVGITSMVGEAGIIATEIREISRINIIVTVIPTISFFILAEKIKHRMKLLM